MSDNNEREALAGVLYDAWDKEEGNSIPYLSSEARQSLADAILAAGFRRAPIEDAEPPEADATPDEAFELGRVAGYDEAMREVAEDAEPKCEHGIALSDLCEQVSQYANAEYAEPVMSADYREGFDAGYRARERDEAGDAEPVAYEVRGKSDGLDFGVIKPGDVSVSYANEFDLIPLYRHPSAPIEVTDEALRAAWFEWISHEERGADEMRAALTAAFKELNR